MGDHPFVTDLVTPDLSRVQAPPTIQWKMTTAQRSDWLQCFRITVLAIEGIELIGYIYIYIHGLGLVTQFCPNFRVFFWGFFLNRFCFPSFRVGFFECFPAWSPNFFEIAQLVVLTEPVQMIL